MKQYHWIVSYDEQNGWNIDTDSEGVRFPDGTIYDTENNEWLFGYQGDGEFVEGEERLTSLLTQLLYTINEAKL